MTEYLVVGLGIAGVAFCETLVKHGKSFHVIDDKREKASLVAGGICNPVVLKRLNKAWMAEEQLPLATSFYGGLQKKLGKQIHYPQPVFRKFANREEQEQWAQAAATPDLKNFLNPGPIRNENPALNAPYGLGEVLGAGRVDTGELINGYTSCLLENRQITHANFDHSKLQRLSDHWSYDGFPVKNVVFATGFRLVGDPYFGYLPMQGNKGEYLEIFAPELKEDRLVKGAVFLIPLGSHRYLAGATYNWKNLSPGPTAEARKYLVNKLEGLINCPFEISGQVAGVRPTVPDRRPLLGRHPRYDGMYVLNGFGSRGLMMAPYAAEALYQFIAYGKSLPPEIDISRYSGRS